MDNESEKITRREFLKTSGVMVGAFAMPKEIFESLDKSDDSFKDVSQSYIADTPQEADRIAQVIRRDRTASASNVCGPLATSILMGWKLNEDSTISNISDNTTINSRMEGVTPREMWLGSPESDPNRYEVAFPSNQYDTFRVKDSVGNLDFNNIPGAGELKPGDFLYLDGGSFTHYIAISRRDSMGRLYTVSNVQGEKPGEFLIKELMLWDPVQKDGFFRNWAKGVGPEKARTGLKGFYLWRRKEETEHIAVDPVTRKYRDILLNEMLEQKKGVWHISMYEVGKGQIFEWRDGVTYHAASTIKVPLAIVTLQNILSTYPEEIERDGLEKVLKAHGTEDRTFNQLLSSMIVNSEESATEILARFSQSKQRMTEWFKPLGMETTTYKPRRTKQRELFNCWLNLFRGKLLDKEPMKYLLNKLEEYTPNDDNLIGSIRMRFPGARQWNKRGTITDKILTVQDSGILEIPSDSGNRYFYIGISATSKEENSIKYEEMLSIISSITSTMGDYIKESNFRKDRSTPPRLPR